VNEKYEREREREREEEERYLILKLWMKRSQYGHRLD
jgi:hypothetical protein